MNTPKRMTPSEIMALGAEKREAMRRQRAALDARKTKRADAREWSFANENGQWTALALGPCVKAIFK